MNDDRQARLMRALEEERKQHESARGNVRGLTAKIERLELELHTMRTWRDRPLPGDAVIAAAFPTRSGLHETYAEALRLVSARHSKSALVALVNWLLVERDAARGELAEFRAKVQDFFGADGGWVLWLEGKGPDPTHKDCRAALQAAEARVADLDGARNVPMADRYGCMGCPMVDGVCPHCGNCAGPP